ncbi:FAD-dependent oxidoreductase [Desulfoplanes formicivorans]|uniref:Pyridine nucleotide-disulfide oxidoreductase n=1 Tax=Desulfoplanes formicivorans TaxID=1592317 RepID=A0A194AG71_9BACT|nr:FAD-dependent oxidoreductase [Desulfoplanes formicivorans]GAU09077.1 pyridine nucleotide-disulfide oxidoreductase [Desulfoplanes formicivorans]
MSQHVVIIGGVALGPKAACRLKRVQPDARVTMIDSQKIISYGGCGIPYLVSGDVSDPDQLRTTNFHALRDEAFFRQAKGVDVLSETTVLKIDRARKKVLVQEKGQKPREIGYDKLVLATGSRPRPLPIPGTDLPGCLAVGSMEDALTIREMVTTGKVSRAVIVGAGFIGLEMAEALTDMWGIETSVIEVADQVLPGVVSRTLASMAQKHLADNDVSLHLAEMVTAIEGEGKVERVITTKRTLEADLVILAAGVLPNAELARDAGLSVSSSTGAILVNKTMQTSDPDIYSGGDCVAIENLITGKPAMFPLGSMANRQGRVIGTNLAGGRATFPGAVGSLSIKLFDAGIAGTGLTLKRAQAEGFDAISAQVIQFDHAHFYPEKTLITLELVVEKGTRRVLGIQGMSKNLEGVAGRINAVAAILKYKPTIEDISNLELAYSPPFAAAMDVLNVVANVADNILAGRNTPITPDEFARMWAGRKDDNFIVLDCRDRDNAIKFLEKHPDFWMNITGETIQEHVDELPKDKKIVLMCNTGARSYEAQVKLTKAGLNDTVNLQGGWGNLRQWGLDPTTED